ncbi:MAG: hypothetical protein ACK4R2_10585 [Roseateles sp.]
MLKLQRADGPDELLFGDIAEAAANEIRPRERASLYDLLQDFRQWDAAVDLHEDRLPLQRPRMLATWQSARASSDIGTLRRWCIEGAVNAAALHRMHWWLESVVALFEIRLRWGTRETERA